MKLVSVFITLSVFIIHFNQESTSHFTAFIKPIYRVDTDSPEVVCSGALISERRLLTSAICIENGTAELSTSADKEKKVLSFIVPDPSKPYSDQIAILTIDPPFELDGTNTAKILVDSENIDMDIDKVTNPLPVFQFFNTPKGIERRNTIPKNFVKGLDLLYKHLYLEYGYAANESACGSLESCVGCPVVRDNLLVGIVIRRHDTDENDCILTTGAIAIRTPIYSNWIEDQIRKDLYPLKQENTGDDQVSAPFLVSIQRYTSTRTTKHYCSGTLITPSLVLTAAICLKHNFKKIMLVAGITSLDDPVGQRRRIYSSSTPPGHADKEREQIAVVTVYPPYIKDTITNTIVVSPYQMCGKLDFNQYLIDSEKINKNHYVLDPDVKLPEMQMQIQPFGADNIFIFECSVKLGSSIGAPVIFQEEVVGVIIITLKEQYCDLATEKIAVRAEKSMKWLTDEMQEKT